LTKQSPTPTPREPSDTAAVVGDTNTPDAGEVVLSPGRLRAWRHVHSVTLQALADAAGVSAAVVQATETGHPSAPHPTPEMITAWADVLGCHTEQLCSTTPHGQFEYWDAAVEAMPPMTTDDLAVVADIIARTHRHTRDRDRDH
jgi:transcriptional regulator with XRE-family HTH domain